MWLYLDLSSKFNEPAGIPWLLPLRLLLISKQTNFHVATPACASLSTHASNFPPNLAGRFQLVPTISPVHAWASVRVWLHGSSPQKEDAAEEGHLYLWEVQFIYSLLLFRTKSPVWPLLRVSSKKIVDSYTAAGHWEVWHTSTVLI